MMYVINGMKINNDSGRVVGFMTNLGFHTLDKVFDDIERHRSQYVLYVDRLVYKIDVVYDYGDETCDHRRLVINVIGDAFKNVSDVLPIREVF